MTNIEKAQEYLNNLEAEMAQETFNFCMITRG